MQKYSHKIILAKSHRITEILLTCVNTIAGFLTCFWLIVLHIAMIALMCRLWFVCRCQSVQWLHRRFLRRDGWRPPADVGTDETCQVQLCFLLPVQHETGAARIFTVIVMYCLLTVQAPTASYVMTGLLLWWCVIIMYAWSDHTSLAQYSSTTCTIHSAWLSSVRF